MKPTTRLILFLIKSAVAILVPAIHPNMTPFEWITLVLALATGMSDKALAFFDAPEPKQPTVPTVATADASVTASPSLNPLDHEQTK